MVGKQMANDDSFFKFYGVDPFLTSIDYSKVISEKKKYWEKQENKSDQSASEKKKSADKAKRTKDDLEEFNKNQAGFTAKVESERAGAQNQFKADLSKKVLSKSTKSSDGNIYISETVLTQEVADSLKKIWPFVDSKNIVKCIEKIDVKIAPKSKSDNAPYQTLYKKLQDFDGSITRWNNHICGLTRLKPENLTQLSNNASFNQIQKNIQLITQVVNKIQDISKYKDENGPLIKEQLQAINNIMKEKEYEGYLQYVNKQKMIPTIRRILDENADDLDDRHVITDILDQLLREGINVSEMMPEIEGYCILKGYKANFSKDDLNSITCPSCGAWIQDNPNITCCTNCGKPLYELCPACNRKIRAGSIACGYCGANAEALIQRSREDEKKFYESLNRGETLQAKDILINLKKSYPAFTGLAKMEQEYNGKASRIDSLSAKITELEKKNQYYELRVVCDQILRLAPDHIKAKTLSSLAKTRVKDAEDHISLAKKKTDPTEKSNEYIEALNYCPDHPEIKTYFKNSKPESPAGLKASIGDNCIILKIIPPKVKDNATTYMLIRKEGNFPISNLDGITLLEDTVVSTYKDTKIESGRSYFYAAFSKRLDTVSDNPAYCGPIELFSDVVDAQTSPIDKGIEITFEPPKGCDSIQIWRKEGSAIAANGKGELIYNGQPVHTYHDLGLSLNKTYYYCIIVVYSKNRSKPVYTNGIMCAPCKPIKIPDPIEDLSITKRQSDFEAKWTGSNCHLYYSETKESIHGVVPIHQFNLKLLKTQSETNNSATFTLQKDIVYYLYPVIEVGNVRVVGNSVAVSQLNNVTRLRGNITSNNCNIQFDWPKNNGCEKVFIMIAPTEKEATLCNPSAK